MRYRSAKQNDGTYNIEESETGFSWHIIQTGVRGCNVDRIINKLHRLDFSAT